MPSDIHVCGSLLLRIEILHYPNVAPLGTILHNIYCMPKPCLLCNLMYPHPNAAYINVTICISRNT